MATSVKHSSPSHFSRVATPSAMPAPRPISLGDLRGFAEGVRGLSAAVADRQIIIPNNQAVYVYAATTLPVHTCGVMGSRLVSLRPITTHFQFTWKSSPKPQFPYTLRNNTDTKTHATHTKRTHMTICQWASSWNELYFSARLLQLEAQHEVPLFGTVARPADGAHMVSRPSQQQSPMICLPQVTRASK